MLQMTMVSKVCFMKLGEIYALYVIHSTVKNAQHLRDLQELQLRTTTSTVSILSFSGPSCWKGVLRYPLDKISIEWIMQLMCLILIRWIAIYPVDSAIQLLNNWSQNFKIKLQKTSFEKGRRRVQTCMRQPTNIP